MRDITTKEVRKFRVDSTRGADIAWVDVSRFETASVWLGSALAITATIELVYGNTKEFVKLFGTTKELSANPDEETSIDVTNFQWLGARIKTAGASSETVDLFFMASSAQGTGQIISQNTIEGR